MIRKPQELLNLTRKADFLGPLALRLYLAHVMWMAGTTSVLITGLAAACHESIGLNRLGSKAFSCLGYPKQSTSFYGGNKVS